MEQTFKFKLGDLVRHKAAGRLGVKMIVIGYGTMTTSTGTENIYHLHWEKGFAVGPRDDTFGSAILGEEVLELVGQEKQ